MEPAPDRRHWPRLTLTLPPEASDRLDTMARRNLRDRKREALRLECSKVSRATSLSSEMSDRLVLALEELVDALRAEVRDNYGPRPRRARLPSSSSRWPRSLTAPASADYAYLGVADGSVRSVKVRGRRLVPASELARLVEAAEPRPGRRARR